MAEGDRLPDDETWYRILKREEFIADGTRISEGALKQGAISANTKPHRGWQHELSGRRSSLCGDVDAHATAYIEALQQSRADRGKARDPNVRYSGIAYATARVLRDQITDVVRSDVVHTPIEGTDDAHTDFVTFGSTDDDKDEIRTWLQDRLAISRPGAAHAFQIKQPVATPSATTTTITKPTTL